MASVARLFRCVQPLRPSLLAVRNMVTLKDISLRLKSVKNIQKITKSMKMVAAAKYARAERELKPARTFGQGCLALFDRANLVEEAAERKGNHLILAMTSDRGLCGSIHSNVAKAVKAIMQGRDSSSTAVVCVGDKVRTVLQRTHRSKILLSFNEVGRKPPVFCEASFIAQQILDSGYEFDSAEIVYNRFKSVIAFRTTLQPFLPLRVLSESEKLSIYDDVDAEVLRCYHEMLLVNLIHLAQKEGACSEQSSRMTAMDAASKNCTEMIDKLTLTYNRKRQAVITRELIEIISGASAL